jgi:hypothetical protein
MHSIGLGHVSQLSPALPHADAEVPVMQVWPLQQPAHVALQGTASIGVIAASGMGATTASGGP